MLLFFLFGCFVGFPGQSDSWGGGGGRGKRGGDGRDRKCEERKMGKAGCEVHKMTEAGSILIGKANDSIVIKPQSTSNNFEVSRGDTSKFLTHLTCE